VEQLERNQKLIFQATTLLKDNNYQLLTDQNQRIQNLENFLGFGSSLAISQPSALLEQQQAETEVTFEQLQAQIQLPLKNGS
jgi:hypothetical protein